MTKTVAAILAGGSGTRFGSSRPKQFEMLAGHTIIEHTIKAFESHELIDSIIVVMHPTCIADTEKLIQKNSFKKVVKIVSGGENRSLSSMAAIEACEGLSKTDIDILIHDAARPLVSSKIISDVVNALKNSKAVNVAVSSTDTLIRIDDQGSMLKIPDRNFIKHVQTPQGFKLSTISKAYELAFNDPDFSATDDCGVVFKYLPEVKIAVVEGDKMNVKITQKEDIVLAEAIYNLRK